MATEALALPRLVGRWFLNATSHVGRVAMLVVDLVRSLNEVRIWLPRMLDRGLEHRGRAACSSCCSSPASPAA